MSVHAIEGGSPVQRARPGWGTDNRAVSHYFRPADTQLWNPSNGVARLFVDQLNA